MIDVRRNGKKEYEKAFQISNMTCYVKFRAPYLPSLTSGSFKWLIFERIFSNHHEIHDRYEKKWENERSKGILNFKCDMLCEFLGSISSFFWIQGPPDVLYLKEYFQIFMTFMINMIRKRKKEDKKYFKFQTWHDMWSSGLHIYILLNAGSSIWLVFESVSSNNHELYYEYD